MHMRRTHNQHANHWVLSGRFMMLFIALFLSAQLLASAHNAAHGDKDHMHDGIPCIMASTSKHCDDMDIAHTAPVLQPQLFRDRPTETVRRSARATQRSTWLIRGPPLFA